MIKQRNGTGTDYSKVNWDLPDSEIARQLNISREAARQTRKKLGIEKPLYFRVRMNSLKQEETLRKHWNPKMSVSTVVNLLNISHSKAYRLLKKHNLSFNP